MPAPFHAKVVDILKPHAEEYRATIGPKGDKDPARLQAREDLLDDLAKKSTAVGHPYTVKQIDGWYKNHIRSLNGDGGKDPAGAAFTKAHRPKTIWELLPAWYEDRIADLIPADTGKNEFLAKYTAARKQVLTELSDGEKKELEDELVRREKVGLPAKQQRKNAEKSMGRDVAKFIQYMAEQHGAMVTVHFAAYLPNGTLRRAVVSTEVLGNCLLDPTPQPTTVDRFDDEIIKQSKAYMAEFDRVAEEELEHRENFQRVLSVAIADGAVEEGGEVDQEALKAYKEVPEAVQDWLKEGAPDDKGFTELEFDDDGNAIVPNPQDIPGFYKGSRACVDVARALLNHAYAAASGNPKAATPWTEIQKSSPSEWLSYWPETYQFNGREYPMVWQEIGRMPRPAVRAVVKGLYDRQENGEEFIRFLQVREEDKVVRHAGGASKTKKGKARKQPPPPSVAPPPEPVQRWNGKSMKDIPLDELKDEVSALAGGDDARLARAVRIAYRMLGDSRLPLPLFEIDNVLPEPGCLQLIELENHKRGWQVEGAYALAPGVSRDPELVDTLLSWVDSRHAWMDNTGTKIKSFPAMYNLVWMLAQVRGAFKQAGDTDDDTWQKLKTISTRAVYWVSTLVCYNWEEDTATFRHAEAADDVDAHSPLANRDNRWAYVCGLWNYHSFQELAAFLQPFYDARFPVGTCLCIHITPDEMPEAFGDWAWPYKDLDTATSGDRWDEFVLWLDAVLRLNLDVEKDTEKYKTLKTRLSSLSWRAVEELLLCIGLLMKQRDKKKKSKKWTDRVKECRQFCDILLKAWQEAGLKGISSQAGGSGNGETEGGGSKRKASEGTGHEPPPKRVQGTAGVSKERRTP